MAQIERVGGAPQMLENPIDDQLLLDPRDDLERAAATPTPPNLNAKYALQAPDPGHRPVAMDVGLLRRARWRLALDFSIGYSDRDTGTVDLFIESSFTFLAHAPEAAVPLRRE